VLGRWRDGDEVVTGLLVAVAAAVAAFGVRATARTAGAAGVWWVAALGAGTAAVAVSRAGAPVPAGLALVGAGLAVGAVVDAAEGRIPTPVAYATTAVSATSLLVHGWRSGEWGAVAGAAALTAVVVGTCAALWVAGAVGFGDVRLAFGTATAMLGGPVALLVWLWVTAVVAGAMAVVRRVVERRAPRWTVAAGPRRPLPFAPPLAVGWLCAVVIA
jgi:prepilin signal peptidase PulO-like enzyme (type II secretory pathway)